MHSTDRDQTIGKRIAMIRKRRGMTQAELAAASGVGKFVVFHLEHGHTPVSLSQAERLVAALHCKLADLLAPPDALIRGRRARAEQSRTQAESLPYSGFYCAKSAG